MEDCQLELLLRDIESDRTERKASLSGESRERTRQAICAFANDLPNHREPGVVFVGANDDGSCANLPMTDELLRTLSDMRSDGNILPIPTMTVQKRTIAGCELAVVIVEPSHAPPVRYKGQVWIRIGPRRAIATAEDERRLVEKRIGRDLPFDIRPVIGASIEEFDIELFRRVYLPCAVSSDVLEANDRSVEDQLASLRFTAVQPEGKPTVLGILVVGGDPSRFVPGAYVQFLRLEGTELTDPIRDQKEVGGPLPHVLQRLDDLFDAHVSVGTAVTEGPLEVRRPDYPIVALQQLARNAVLHRTYEYSNAPVRIYWFTDRVEIHSPGGPFGQVTRDNFGQPGFTDYRNPHLAEAMRNLGYVQRFGVGIPWARRALEENGNPPPEFIAQETHVLAVLRGQL